VLASIVAAIALPHLQAANSKAMEAWFIAIGWGDRGF
jgi:hypothetical protein